MSSDNCSNLAKEITEIRNELAKRVQELRENKNKLPLTGKNSIQGHFHQMDGKQRKLRDLLDQYDRNGCGGGSGGSEIPSDAWKYATTHGYSPEQEELKKRLGDDNLRKFAIIVGISGAAVLALLSMPAWGGATVAASFALFFAQQ